MKDHTKAYMAGLIDTDGTMGIYFLGESGYQIRLAFNNDDQPLMKWIVNNFGGTYKATPPDVRRSTQGFVWMPQGREHLRSFIDSIIPFLVSKKPEASIIRDFVDIGHAIVPEIRQRLSKECKLLKKQRGIVETDTLRNFLDTKPSLRHAYIAGMIDGDGNIGVYQDPAPGTAKAMITNQCLPILQEIKHLYGGSIYECKKGTWRWQSSRMKDTELLLLGIIPHLVIKREKGKEALSYIRHRFANPTKKFMIQSGLMSNHERALLETTEA